jgi:hypothetical protein
MSSAVFRTGLLAPHVVLAGTVLVTPGLEVLFRHFLVVAFVKNVH